MSNGSGCSSHCEKEVVVNAGPTATAENNGPVCAGGSVQLTGGPGGMASYSWTGPDGYTSNTQSPLVNPAVAGLYTLTVTDANGCSDSESTTVVVNAGPTATAENSGPVCAGGSVQLTGGPEGMASYSWTGPDGYTSNTQSPLVNPAVAGLYTLTVTDANGCSDSESTTVVVNAGPTATAENNGPVCAGGSVQLTGGPGGMASYSWTGPDGYTSNTQSPLVNPAVAGLYTLTVTDANGCSDSEATTVVVNAGPTATAENNGPVCAGGSVQLTGGPGGMASYSWTGPSGYTSNTQSPLVNPAVAGLYTLTVTDANGCSDSEATTVVVNAGPTATAENNGPVCAGGSVQLTGGPGGMASYSWTGPDGYTSNTQSPLVNPAVAGLYTLTVTDANGCSDSESTTVVVNAGPTATAENNGPVCAGGSVQLTGGPGGMASYSWTGPDGYTSNTQSPLVNPAVAGLYTLTVTDANGCSDSESTTVVVNAGPTATAENNGPVCAGGSVQLTGGPGGMASYSWTGPGGYTSNTQSPLVNPAVAGLYTLTVTDANGCSDSESTTVVVNAKPDCTITAPDSACAGFTDNTASVTSAGEGGRPTSGRLETAPSPHRSPMVTKSPLRRVVWAP